MSQPPASPQRASPTDNINNNSKKKARRPRSSAHPPVADMVRAAIVSLKDRKGSSLVAIKKYIQAKYKVDMVRIAPFIRRYLKKAVADGSLKQASGTGAAGRFRIGKAKAAPKKKKAKKAKKPKKAKKAKKAKKPKAKKAKKPKAKKAKKSKAKKAKKPKAKRASKPKSAKKPKTKKAKRAPKKKSSKKAAKK
jgi:histone H1/5